MRFPRIDIMKPTFDLIENRLKLDNLIEYKMWWPNERMLFNGKCMSVKDVNADNVSGNHDPFKTNAVPTGSVDDLLHSAFGSLMDALMKDIRSGLDDLMKLDRLSARDYLVRNGWTDDVGSAFS